MEEIRSKACPTCFLCNSAGELLHQHMKDALYGVAGRWTLKRCSNRDCGLLWLDPMPAESDIGKAYATYHTHGDDESGVQRVGLLERMLRRAYDGMFEATPIFREREQLRSMCLSDCMPGKLLDVGCGDGSRMVRLQALGWNVSGQEVDPVAAAQAYRRSNAPIFVGPLEEATFPESSFDAVTLSHVVEHVHDPLRLLRTCWRLLKTGGLLVVITPNGDSYGHDRFGFYWRGLEPPRHLHVFSPRTLRVAATEAGFSKSETWTSTANAKAFVIGSFHNKFVAHGDPRGAARLRLKIVTAIYQLRMFLAHQRNPDSGEECVLKAIR